MSAIMYSLQQTLRLQIGRHFNSWEFDQITFSNFGPVTRPLGDADMQCTATVGQKTHVLAYKRINISAVFANFPHLLKPVPVIDAMTPAQFTAALVARFGVPILQEDIDFVKTVIAPGEFTVFISVDSKYYTGSFKVLAAKAEPEIIDRTSTAIHRWPLNGNGQPSVGDEPLTAVFDYETINGVVYAGLNTDRVEPLGVALPCRGDFTLQFKLYVKSIGADKLGLFTVDGSGAGTDVKLGKASVGNYYPYVRGTVAYNAYDGAGGVVLPIGTEATVTMRGVAGDRVEVYINGRLANVIDKTNQVDAAWTHFGRSDTYLGPTVRIRDIVYYDHAIDIAPGQGYAVLSEPLSLWNAQPWYLDNVALDSRNVTMKKYNPALLTYGYDYTKYTSFLKTLVAFPRPWNNANDMLTAATLNSLRDAMKDVDGNPWVWTSTLNTAFNLYRCAVIYNGKTKDCGKVVTGKMLMGEVQLDDWLMKSFTPANLEYDNVVVFWLKSTWENNEGYGAVVMLHYNDEV